MSEDWQAIARKYRGCCDRMRDVSLIVKQQAEDDGIWFEAQTAPEAYLQQELRRLHSAIEGKS